ncbi:MAG: SGNH/GDSL hydrolase family protein [Minicystis sp.]
MSDDAPPPNKLRETGKKIIALGVSILFSFLVLETYVRLTYTSQWHIPKSAVREPGIFNARMKPNNEVDIALLDGGTFHVKTNERGFRGPLVSTIEGKPLRVISLGDSFTFGWGVPLEDHCMYKLMDEYKKAHADRDVGHAYVACGSWDPKDYYMGYVTEASQAKPDLVVLGVFTGNDIMPNDLPRILDPAKYPYADKLPEPPRPWIRSFDWVRAQLSGSLVVASFRAKHSKPVAFAPFENDMAKQKQLWDTSFFYLKALNDSIRKDGGRLALILYPSMLQVNTAKALDNAGYDHTMPERVLGEFCKENGIELVTLLEALQQNNQKQDLYFLKDRHLTVRGNEIAKGVLEQKLRPVIDKIWEEKLRARAAAQAPAPTPAPSPN